jgi:hypothetical protein
MAITKIIYCRILQFTILLIGIFTIITCSEPKRDLELHIDIEPRLDVDANGYYHLVLKGMTWQTTHRLSGHITAEEQPAENVRIEWTSSHYWRLNDTLGYYIDYGYTDQLEYVALDTTYITGFGDYIAPTVNCCSYSNADGEINTMIAPVRSMIGDTMTVGIQFSDDEPIGEFFIILE